MKKYLLPFFLILLLPLIAYSWMGPIIAGCGNSTVSAGGGTALSDDFNRGDSSNIGSDWLEYHQGASIVSNALKLEYVDNDWVMVVNTNNLSSINQYAMIDNNGEQKVGTILRSSSDGTGVKYSVLSNAASNTMEWRVFTGSGWTANINVAVALIHAANDRVGVIIQGTGNDSVLSLWLNPTNNSPHNFGSGCTDSAKPCWDNAGDAPDVQDLSNPSTAADTGTYVGISSDLDSGNKTIDDFYGGTLD